MSRDKYTSVKDSGAREEFPTGSVRDTRDGKGRFDLISPIALRRLAEHYENGARKYGDRNWEKGQKLSRYLDSAIRHLFRFLEGDRSEDHMSAAAWNVFGYIHTEHQIKAGKLPVELDDVNQDTGPSFQGILSNFGCDVATGPDVTVLHDVAAINVPQPQYPDTLSFDEYYEQRTGDKSL